eukprot:TRINITY_DN8918_c0_g1_i2.p1 TRINITY_DN8918_c0_g1~~TRINITY_DN8918_c0_g1_i2.p1  ORF type:complete len:376 (+),score=66.38 TRINITY_DN8918_c0_g1_i2:129-1130(+)
MTNWYYVTGTDSGFGAELVKMLANKKLNVFAGHYLLESAKTLSDISDCVIPVHLDVTNDESVTKAAKQIGDKLESCGGKLVGVVNNAGLLLQSGPTEWTPISNYQKMYDVNVLGTVRVTNSVLPFLRKSKGRIVNCASIAGRQGLATQSAYCASKFAVEGYSESLRREMRCWGVTVHIVEPGVFAATGLYSTYHNGVQSLWDRTPEHIQKDYGEDFKEAVVKASQAGLAKYNNKDTSLVPKAYFHALTDPHPRFRYRVGFDSQYIFTILSHVHESWQDTLMSGGAKITPATADKKNWTVADKRYPGWTLMRRIIFGFVLYVIWKLIVKKRPLF